MTGGRGAVRRVAVIGGGVLGASVAAALATTGDAVTLLTDGDGKTTPASAASFAWVNARDKSPESYRRLNEDARRRHGESQAGWFVRSGAIADGTELPEDGYVDTSAFIATHLDAARAAGAIIRTGTTVGSLDELRGAFDVVVVAGGTATAGLVRDLPGAARRLSKTEGADGFLARIAVDEHPIHRIVSVDGLQARPDGDGTVAVQSLAIERSLRERRAAASVDTVWPALRDEIATKLAWRVPASARVTVARAARPHAADGLPVVGWVSDDAYVVLSHSGVTLAPLLAELVARDLRGDEDPRLAAWRP